MQVFTFTDGAGRDALVRSWTSRLWQTEAAEGCTISDQIKIYCLHSRKDFSEHVLGFFQDDNVWMKHVISRELHFWLKSQTNYFSLQMVFLLF